MDPDRDNTSANKFYTFILLNPCQNLEVVRLKSDPRCSSHSAVILESVYLLSLSSLSWFHGKTTILLRKVEKFESRLSAKLFYSRCCPVR